LKITSRLSLIAPLCEPDETDWESEWIDLGGEG
jgi:hypothetical protein